ncbi:MAG: hypothetical protein ACM3U2_16510, partial [Deltaproteobacteria bacterium]
PAEKLIRSLTEGPSPYLIAWKKDGPAPFDDGAESRIRKRLRDEYAAAGFYYPEFAVKLERDASAGTAHVVVNVQDEGPRAVVGKIQVSGGKRDSPEDVLKYLNVHPGDPYDSGLRSRLQNRLIESGRYLAVKVEEEYPYPEAEHPDAGQALRIRLYEYDKAPPLAHELSPAEQALVKMHDWFERWSNGEIDGDLVVTMQMPLAAFADDWPELTDLLPEDARPLVGKLSDVVLSFRFVMSPKHGQITALQAAHAGKTPFLDAHYVVHSNQIILADLHRQAKLVIPYSPRTRLIFNVDGSAAGTKHVKEEDSKFRLSFGMAMNQGRKHPAPFEIRTAFSPVFLLDFAHQDGAHAELADGVCKVFTDLFEMDVDPASGRLREWRVKAGTGRAPPGASFVIRIQNGALQSEIANLEKPLAAVAETYDANSPWKSVVAFLADECLHVADSQGFGKQVGPLRALCKVVNAWSPPGFGEVWSRKSGDDSNPDDPFRVPSQFGGFSYDGLGQPGSLTRKFLVGVALPVFRRLVGNNGWLWQAGRDAALYWAAEDNSPGLDGSDLFFSSLEWHLQAILGQDAAFPGTRPPNQRAFLEICRPLLANDSWLGRWSQSLALALARLDKSELDALAGFVPEETLRKALVEGLSVRGKQSEQSPPDVLHSALERVWAGVIGPRLEAASGECRTASPREPLKPIPHGRVVPAAAEEFPDDPSGGDAIPIPEPAPRPAPTPGSRGAKAGFHFDRER